MTRLNLLLTGCLIDGTKNHNPFHRNSPAWFAIRGLSIIDEKIERSDDISDAEAALKESLKLNPEYAFGNLCMGIFYLTLGNHKESILFLNRAKSLGLNNSHLDYYLAVAQYNVGDINTSLDTINQGLLKYDYDSQWYEKLINLKSKAMNRI